MEDSGYTMDDLFGDTEPVSLPAPPNKLLAERLNELSVSGCCQKFAWSKNGSVASISPDGYRVNLRVFSRDPSTGKWELGQGVPLEGVPGHGEIKFVHVSWNTTGTELAVVDAAGHVSYSVIQAVLDRMVLRVENTQLDGDIDAVVGMHWLAVFPHEQKPHIAWSATGKNNLWTVRTTSHMSQDAHHALDNKTSMIYLKRCGEVKLRYQQDNNIWLEVSTTIGPSVSTSEAFSHASFASHNENTLLLAAYDVCGRLHLYRIEIKWNVPPNNPGPVTKLLGKPELLVSEISTEDSCYPLGAAVVAGELSSGTPSNIRSQDKLTHLSFLPKTPQQDDGTFPTIQAIFSTPPNVVTFDQTQPNQHPYSTLVRWEVHHTKRAQLHSCLDQVTSKKKSVSSIPHREGFILKRLPDIVLHSAVLAFYPLWYNMLLAYCYSDGTIEFRKRENMDMVRPDYNTETVTSLSQAGFAFPILEPSLHVALSPNHCIAAYMQEDGVIKIRSMDYSHGSLSSDDEDPKLSAALAALVLQFTSAGYQYISSDDIFSLIGDLPEQRKYDFVNLLYQNTGSINLDCSSTEDPKNNHNILLRMPFLVKMLSATHLLGLQGSIQRSIPSKVAWIIINVKYVTQWLYVINQLQDQNKKGPLRPELVPHLTGLWRWTMNFIVYMIDDLFNLGRALDTQQTDIDRSTLESKIASLDHPAILVLLSSYPRKLMASWSIYRGMITRISSIHQNSAESRRTLAPIHAALSEVPLDWPRFESLLGEATNAVRQAFKLANLSAVERNQAERELVLGRCPDVLVPAAKRILKEYLYDSSLSNGCLADKVDVGAIYFYDTEWLGLTSSKHAIEWHKKHIVDVCQKTEIRGPGTQMHLKLNGSANRSRGETVDGARRQRKIKLRRCTRCGAFTEDIVPGLPGYTNGNGGWLSNVAKSCICGNSWMLVNEAERAR